MLQPGRARVVFAAPVLIRYGGVEDPGGMFSTSHLNIAKIIKMIIK